MLGFKAEGEEEEEWRVGEGVRSLSPSCALILMMCIALIRKWDYCYVLVSIVLCAVFIALPTPADIVSDLLLNDLSQYCLAPTCSLMTCLCTV